MISITKLLMDAPIYGDQLRYTPKAHEAKNGVSEGRGPVVVWNCTKTCNLKCVHCYARSEAIKYQNELTHEEGLALIDQLAEFKVPVILFSGGEPLLHPDIVRIVRAAKSRGVTVILLTNGILLLPNDANGFVMASALLGWGGLSVHCQTAAVLEGSGLKLFPYLLAKLAQCGLSAVLAFAVRGWLFA